MKQKKPFKTIEESLAYGLYTIMRKVSSYRLEHFFRDDFNSSQFFALIDLVLFENKLEEDAHKKNQKKKGK